MSAPRPTAGMTDEDWLAVARVFYAVHQRRAQQESDAATVPAEPGTVTATDNDAPSGRQAEGGRRRGQC